MMPHYQRFGEQEAQLAQQCQHTSLLHQSTRIGRCAVRRESSFIADADRMPVMVLAMRSHLFQRSSAVNLSVTGDIEMISYVREAPVADVVPAASLKIQPPPLRDALIGGETAEMPGMYGEDDYDLAGFAVGIAEKSQIIDGSKVAEGDVLLGLASSGIHSNGYSLVRRVFADYTGEEVLPELEGKKLKDVLLEPTRIYVKAALPLIKEELVNGIAHITGGGFIENVPRMFSDDLAAEIDESKVPVLPIFKALEKYGEIKHEEMFEIFNMGIGLMLAVKPENVERVKELLDEPVYEIGRIVKKDGASVVIK